MSSEVERPCPACTLEISSQEKICPHCGSNTDFVEPKPKVDAPPDVVVPDGELPPLPPPVDVTPLNNVSPPEPPPPPEVTPPATKEIPPRKKPSVTAPKDKKTPKSIKHARGIICPHCGKSLLPVFQLTGKISVSSPSDLAEIPDHIWPIAVNHFWQGYITKWLQDCVDGLHAAHQYETAEKWKLILRHTELVRGDSIPEDGIERSAGYVMFLGVLETATLPKLKVEPKDVLDLGLLRAREDIKTSIRVTNVGGGVLEGELEYVHKRKQFKKGRFECPPGRSEELSVVFGIDDGIPSPTRLRVRSNAGERELEIRCRREKVYPQLEATSWGEVLLYISVGSVLAGIIGGLGGMLVGAVGLWMNTWPAVGGVLGGVLGLIWFGFFALLVANSFKTTIGKKSSVPFQIIASLPIFIMGTWLAISVGLHNNLWNGALWLGLGSLSMGALIGAGFGLSLKKK